MNNRFERTIKTGRINGHEYELRRRSTDAVAAGAAPYILYVNFEFYCTCENREQAFEELSCI